MHAADEFEQDALNAHAPREERGRAYAPHAADTPTLHLPADALVVLVGTAGTGKSTWAARYFDPYQIVSSDDCRARVADDPADQGASHDAFRLMHQIVRDRLKRGLLTVADSTALAAIQRRDLLNDAAEYGRPAVAIVFDLPSETASIWNSQRPRQVPPAGLAAQEKQMRQAREDLHREGFAQVYVFDSPAALDGARVDIGSIRPDDDQSPFDVVGDVHGCIDELRALLQLLGYAPWGAGYRHPDGRRVVFVGDLVDRGPSSVQVMEVALAMLAAETALLVVGNHDNKFMRWLLGRPVRVARHGLGLTIAEVEGLPAEQRTDLWRRSLHVLRRAPGYLLLDAGRLVVTHAGILDGMLGHWNRRIADFCLYGDVAGVDQHGHPIRRDWAAARQAGEDAPLVVYGHTVVDEPRWINRTIDVDTGCVFGGQLSALRYPEMELVGVPAAQPYSHHHNGNVADD